MSKDGTTFVSNLEVTFDATNWHTPQTVTVKGKVTNKYYRTRAAQLLHQLTTATGSRSLDTLWVQYLNFRILFMQYSFDGASFGSAPLNARLNEGGSFSYWIKLEENPHVPLHVRPAPYYYRHRSWLDGEPPRFKFEPETLTFDRTNYTQPRKVTVTALYDSNTADTLFVEIEHRVWQMAQSQFYSHISVRVADNGYYSIWTNPKPNTIRVTEGGSGQLKFKPHADPGAGITVTVTNPDASKLTLSATTFTFTSGPSGNWDTELTLTVRSTADSIGADETLDLGFVIKNSDATDMDPFLAPFTWNVAVGNSDR